MRVVPFVVKLRIIDYGVFELFGGCLCTLFSVSIDSAQLCLVNQLTFVFLSYRMKITNPCL